MKRSFAVLTSALLLAQLVAPMAFAATAFTDYKVYSGPHGSSYFPDMVVSASHIGSNIYHTYDETEDAADSGTKDVPLYSSTGSALYVGFDSKFDGIALDVGTEGGDARWTLEYWDGSEWIDFYRTVKDLDNDSNGSFSYDWDSEDFDDWETTSIYVSSSPSYTDDYYFVRVYLEDSEYSQTAYFDQVGVLKYNFEVNAQDELGNWFTGEDPEDLLTIENADTNIYGSMEEDGQYRYALHAEGLITDSYTMEYTFAKDGYVDLTGSALVQKDGIKDIDAELEFSHRITTYNDGGWGSLIISSASIDGNECEIGFTSSSEYAAFCAVTPSTSSVPLVQVDHIEVDGHVSYTGFIANRNSSDDEQITADLKLDYAYVVTLKDKNDGSAITGATVTMGDNLDVDCADFDDGTYGCIVPVDEGGDGNISISADGYESVSETLSSTKVRDEADDDQVELSYELEEEEVDESGPDFEVNNIYMSGDDLMVSVGNDGDEDVDESVKIKIYIDDVYEESITSSSADWLEAGGSTVYNLGDDIYDGKDDFEVKVCMDTSEEVDETNEDNNCLTEDIEIDDGDEPDLVVDNLDIQDDGDIVFTVANGGEDDVDDDERVYIYVYVDGDKEWSRSYELDDDEGRWLEEGEERDINVGELFDDDDEHTVRVCVDAKDDVDESDEGNNCSSKELEIGEEPGPSYYCSVFIDMSGHWAADAVCELSDRDIVQGRAYNRYEPNEDVTRAEFLKIILLNAGHDVDGNSSYYYNDVPSYHWSYDYVTYASSLGIVRGYEDGGFHPDDPVTRGEAVVMIMRLYGEELWNYGAHDIVYSDVYTWDWYAYAVILADSYEIVNGYADGRFLPNNYLDRGEAAVIAERTDEALN